MTTETTAEAWQRRTTVRGTVDFTMMYVAHDAFRRDLARLDSAGRAGRITSEDARATWAIFNRQLHLHHATEDTALWPRVRSAGLTDADEAVLEAMETEHEQLDPLLERIEISFTTAAPDQAALRDLSALLGHHMAHEEMEALPMVDRVVGQPGWDAFGREIRAAQGGIRAGATYLPWVLDEAPEPARRTVLGVLPPPARALYRLSWEPRYRRSPHLA